MHNMRDISMRDTTDRPLAADGLTSYRIKGRYGWIMIGAQNADDAMREAGRSTPQPERETLEVWDADASQYVRLNHA